MSDLSLLLRAKRTLCARSGYSPFDRRRGRLSAQSGNQARWNLACTGQMEISGTGETQINGDQFTGRMDLALQMGGDQSMPMVQSFTAKRVGECE